MRPFTSLDRDIQYVRGVGPRRAKLLERLDIRTARDLLYHLPRRYEDASTISKIGQLETGVDATIIGTVVAKGVLPTRKGLRIFQAVLNDGTGYAECSWPGQPFLDRVIEKGDQILVSGTVRFYHGMQLQPREFTIVAGQGDPRVDVDQGRVFPIYPATEGITHRQIRQIIDENLDDLLAEAAREEILPEGLRAEAGVPSLVEALAMLHRPGSVAESEEGRRRLALEELYFLQLIHARAHLEVTRNRQGIALPPGGPLVATLKRTLPFRLTGAQVRALREIGEDMAAPRPMNRLVQGDVGSGKTVVALFAALRAIDNGYQAALMAPTEILAEQHARSISQLLGETGVNVTLLTGSLGSAEKRRRTADVASGEAQLVIGTHALIQESVEFARLGLAIVDEQHRFGVRQRLALAARGGADTPGRRVFPDVLVMSATPIPRSLALTLYGDLDLTVLDERPPGRTPVRTGLRRSRDRGGVFDFVRQQVEAGRQAFVVYPLVEGSETLDLRAATEEYDNLRAEIFADLRIALLHGQLPSEEKDRVMRAFAAGEVDVLVATTVVEVGIDVPNATVMVVEHAERFGLSQLHQLRGRVGRGAEESYCILISDPADAIERLKVFCLTQDGFRIAEEDLRLRGQGDLFGARQSGVADFQHARLEKDLDLLTVARSHARGLIEKDPALESRPDLRDALEKRFGERAELFRVG